MKNIVLLVFSFLMVSCSVENELPDELKNKKWVDVCKYKSNFYKRCGEFDRSVITTANTIQVDLMEMTILDVSRVEKTAEGYKIYTLNTDSEENSENKWHYNFSWIDKAKGIARWEYNTAEGKIEEGFSFVTIDDKLIGKITLADPPCEACFEKKECDSINGQKTKNAFLDSIENSKIDDSWYKEYYVWLESYEVSYNYNYLIRVAKDSSYIQERYVKDLLVPYQKADTLFLYHKKSVVGDDYTKDKTKPEVKIVRIKDQYYIQSQLFDLENSISNKPTKYGFLADEVK